MKNILLFLGIGFLNLYESFHVGNYNNNNVRTSHSHSVRYAADVVADSDSTLDDDTMTTRRHFITTLMVSSAIFGIQVDESLAKSNDDTELVDSSFESSSSTTFHLSAQIRELDMSLPKYDEVKSYKASVETVDSLSKPTSTSNVFSKSTKEEKRKMKEDVKEVKQQEKKKERSSMEYNF